MTADLLADIPAIATPAIGNADLDATMAARIAASTKTVGGRLQIWMIVGDERERQAALAVLERERCRNIEPMTAEEAGRREAHAAAAYDAERPRQTPPDEPAQQPSSDPTTED